MKEQYIKAVINLFAEGADAQVVFQGLKKTMQQKGHMRLYAPVLRGVLRILETKKVDNDAVVTLAKESDAEKFNTTIKEILAKLDTKTSYSTKIDETIIGGVIVKNNYTIVDQSYKSLLLNLYRSITN